MRTPEQIAELKRAITQVDWWHSIDLGDGIVTPGREPNSRSRDAYMNIPWDQIKDQDVLDIGAWDGLYSFEAEKAGARKVTAMEPDTTHVPGFTIARIALDSKVQHIESLARFVRADVVFDFGVLYHLKNPYDHLLQVYGLMRRGGLLILETAVTQTDAKNWPIPMLEFCETEQDGDPTNWNYPNHAWVEAVLRSIGFTEIKLQGGISNRAAWHARKP